MNDADLVGQRSAGGESFEHSSRRGGRASKRFKKASIRRSGEDGHRPKSARRGEKTSQRALGGGNLFWEKQRTELRGNRTGQRVVEGKFSTNAGEEVEVKSRDSEATWCQAVIAQEIRTEVKQSHASRTKGAASLQAAPGGDWQGRSCGTKKREDIRARGKNLRMVVALATGRGSGASGSSAEGLRMTRRGSRLAPHNARKSRGKESSRTGTHMKRQCVGQRLR